MRLNLGCGQSRFEGWINVDAFCPADVAHDLRNFPYPFEPESVEVIFASHVLEHFDRLTGFAVLTECYRILANGGLLRLAVPDMDKFVDCHDSGDFSPLHGYHWTDLNYFCGGDDGEKQLHQRHHYMYTFENLAYKLAQVGFKSAVRRQPGEYDNLNHAAFSLYVEARK